LQWDDENASIFFTTWPTKIKRFLDKYAQVHDFTGVFETQNNIYLSFWIDFDNPLDQKYTRGLKNRDSLRGISYLLVHVEKAQFYEARKRFDAKTGYHFELLDPVGRKDFYEEDSIETMHPIEKLR